MSMINAVLRPFFDLLLAPFRALPAIVSLAVVSLLASVLMLVIFKRTSNQERLAAVKRRIHAGLFEIRLFSDDLRAIFRAQGEILRANVTYVRLSLAPMIFILPPFVLVMAQLQYHYGYEGLRPGRPALITADLDGDLATGSRPAATLEAPDGVRIETETAWLPSAKQVAWRIVAEREGEYQLSLRLGNAPAVTKSLSAGRLPVRRSPIRVGGGFVDQLLHPAESPMPVTSPFRAIRVTYPDAEVSVFGFGMHWMIPFFVLSIVFAFALRGVFKVTI
jgi:uncharacterized membrane protein (DUF106 family)